MKKAVECSWPSIPEVAPRANQVGAMIGLKSAMQSQEAAETNTLGACDPPGIYAVA
jgi:hypothetical protein